MPFLAESMRAYEEGLGTAEDIDTGARVGLNHPMGPLQLADFIGLDVCLEVMRVLHEGFGQEHFRPPKVLEELVAAGHLGQKTGRGSTPTRNLRSPTTLSTASRVLRTVSRSNGFARRPIPRGSTNAAAPG